MFSNSVNIDVQVYEKEIKKPDQSSIILLPLTTKSNVTYQLVLIFENLDNKITAQDIDRAAQMVFKEWQSIFPLYHVERAFADTTVPGKVALYISFEAENIFSTTQTRNIKKTITGIIQTELERILNKNTQKNNDEQEQRELKKHHRTVSAQSYKKSNSQSQVELDNLVQSVDGLSKKYASGIDETMRWLAVDYDASSSQSDDIEKQKEIQRLQRIVSENKRYIEKLQDDYDQLREVSAFQTDQLLDENNQMKSELLEYKNTELLNHQEIQAIRNEMKLVVADNDVIQETLNQKLQRVQYENVALKNAIQENQQFEEKTQNELDQAISELKKIQSTTKQLATEKDFLEKEWTLKYKKLQEEKEEALEAYKKSRESEVLKNNELIDAKTKIITLEQNLQQAKLDYNDFLLNKDKEIKRLTDQLGQQKQLVEKLMANQTTVQSTLQKDYETLEAQYQELKAKLPQLTVEVQRLVDENQNLKEIIANSKLTSSNEKLNPVISDQELVVRDKPKEVPALIEAEPIEQEDQKNEVSNESDDDYDYEYDYEYSYDEDYDYDYHEVDDLVNYNPETIEEDVEELLDNKDDTTKEKISKKDYAVYELYLDHLKELLSQADQPEFEDFKVFADSKMKKYNKFKKELDEGVKPPKLFGRKYKVTVGLADQIRAYVLLGRHLSVLLDVDINDLEDDYDYDYDYDYEYDEDYEYED